MQDLRAVVRENRGFFLKFGKCDLTTDFDKTLHIQSTLRIKNFPEIIDFLAKRCHGNPLSTPRTRIMVFA